MSLQPLNHTVSPIAERIRHAEVLAASNLLPQAFRQSPPNVLVAIEYGNALGIEPIVALNEINVINGTPALSASLMLSLAHMAGHKVRVTGDAKSATCTIIRADDPEFEHVATWDEAKAKAAGLAGRGHWQKDPATMLKWRAVAECVRFACPEVLGGLKYSSDEVADFAPKANGYAPVATVTATQVPHPSTSIAEAIALEAAPEAVASSNSHPEPVVESQAPAKVSKAQLNTLAAEMKRLTLDKAEMLRVVADVIGKTVKSSAELSADEADAVIAALAMLDAPDADGVVDATLVDPWDEADK